jgi:hypothetical protein
MPGVEVWRASEESLWGLLRSMARPTAILGAASGLAFAVQPVEGSPSIARLGSPKLLAG